MANNNGGEERMVVDCGGCAEPEPVAGGCYRINKGLHRGFMDDKDQGIGGKRGEYGRPIMKWW